MDFYSISTLVFLFSLGYWVSSRFLKRERARPLLRTVAIVVLGDVGRSPRMMYHAESFAENQFETYIVGMEGAKPVPSLLSIPHVHFTYLPKLPTFLSTLPFMIGAPLKVMHQVYAILYALLVRIPRPPEYIVVQNPPSIPTLALVWLVALIRGCKVIIDWHNLGYSILALKLGQGHPFVRIAKWFEAYFGRSAYAHLFVTKAMHDFLAEEWNLRGIKAVLHDRPPAHFHRASPFETHELFVRLDRSFATSSLQSFLPPFEVPYSSPLTRVPSRNAPFAPSLQEPGALSSALDSPILAVDMDAGVSPMASLRPDRPALLVSSTSWTPDEDFGILLQALQIYENRARARDREMSKGSTKARLPKVLMIVTGKGPDREKYMKEVEKLQSGTGGADGCGWNWVRCISMWLQPEDYPLILGSADLGISLHSSSSALDLPMKVVDMFGCGLPVCALNFACLDELVHDGVNGLVFENAEQLAAQLESILTAFPASPALSSLRATFEADSKRGSRKTWAENWNQVMRPLIGSNHDATLAALSERSR